MQIHVIPAGLIVCLLLGCQPSLKHTEIQDTIYNDQETYKRIADKLQAQQRASVAKAPKSILVVADDVTRLLDSDLVATYSGKLYETLPRIIFGYPVVYEISKSRENQRVTASSTATTVRDHLDSISLQADVSFKFLDGVLLVSNIVTKEFAIPAFGNAGTTSSGATYNVGHNNLSGTTGSAGFVNSSTHRFNAYTDLTSLIQSITGIGACSGEASSILEAIINQDYAAIRGLQCYSISGAANLLTLTTTPRNMAAFEDAYEDWTTSMNRSASVTLKIVDFDVTDSVQQSFDFSLVRNAAISSKLDATSKGLVDIKPGAGVLRFSFAEGNRWDGTSIVIEALSTLGEVSNIETKEFQVLNNRMLTVRDFTNTGYVQKVSIQDTSQGGTSLSTPSVELGEVVVGNALNILPSITDDIISMHIVYNDATLDGFTPYSFTELLSGTIPTDSGTDNVFDVTLSSGETILVASSHRKTIEVLDEKPSSGLGAIFDSTKTQSAEKRVRQTLFIISANLN